MASPLISPIVNFAGRLRFPTLFMVTAGLFLLDMLIPDVIPLVDEILLGLAALLFSSWKKSRDERPPIDAGR